MKPALTWMSVACVLACMAPSGCTDSWYLDRRPSPPRTASLEQVTSVTVTDPAEQATVTTYQTARVNYKYRLQVLQGYYNRIGNMDKYNWVREEQQNLEEAQTFTWAGAPQVVAPEGESVENADERVLVEYVIAARNVYFKAVTDLAAFYEKKDDVFKARLVHNMQARFAPYRTHMYYLEAEIPGPDLRPVEVIPAADALFDRALQVHLRAKPLPLVTNYTGQREALNLFMQLIREYPHSTKIALAAYCIADIYKEYFNEDVRAVRWYERAWQWDPNIVKPARFQAAVVYDYRLQNHAKALECYKGVIQHEHFSQSNLDFAHRRIKELTDKPAQ